MDVSNEPMANVGDIAMTQVAISRLAEYCAGAQISVITTAPDRCTKVFPNVKAISGLAHKSYCATGSLLGRFSRRVPTFESAMRVRFPRLTARLIAGRRALRGDNGASIREYFAAIESADVVIVPGGGWVADVFEDSTRLVLETLLTAQRFRRPTALLGHAFGPARSPSLLALAGQVLRGATLITLRERRASVPFLRSLGVPDSRFIVTGDDGIEMAHSAHPPTLGDAIGVNVRRTAYSAVDTEQVRALRGCLVQVYQKLHAPFVPIPVAFHTETRADSDVDAINQLLEGLDHVVSAGDHAIDPRDTIKRIGQCRLVITGSYHAAVFALAQGIPSIGLARSSYYQDKFHGLADMFPGGVEVVDLNEAAFERTFHAAVERLWRERDALRPALLASAEKQVEKGRSAYRALCTWLSRRRESGARTNFVTGNGHSVEEQRVD